MKTETTLRICRHFGRCGGCLLLDKDYEEQIQEKILRIKTLTGAEPDEVFKSPTVTYFRNRMDYVVAPGPVVGLNKRGSWSETIDISECLLLSPEAEIIRNSFREYLEENRIEGWDRIRRKGLVRFLTILEGKFTRERLVGVLVSSLNPYIDLEEFKDMLEEKKAAVNALLLGVNTGIRDDVIYEESRIIHGKEDAIRERINSFTYLMHPGVFFQPNSYTLGYLIESVVKLAGLSGWEKIIELFSGAGTFTIPLASKSAQVTAVEINEKAVELAIRNAEINKIKNIKFINSKAEGVSVKGYDLVVLDPPRSGLAKKLVKRLKKTGPRRVIYVSCGLDALVRDVKAMGYKIEYCIFVDQFPHTPLIEVVALLKKG